MAIMSTLTQQLPLKLTSQKALRKESQRWPVANSTPFKTHSRSTAGSAPILERAGDSVANSYLLTQCDAALLIDTGFGRTSR